MHLLVFGLGYSGNAVARLALAKGVRVSATSRDPSRVAAPAGVAMLQFGAGLPEGVTHVLATAAPDEAGDPVLAAYGPALAACASLRWAGYLSTTGVYGDRGGAWVDETTPVAPGQARSARRVVKPGHAFGRIHVDDIAGAVLAAAGQTRAPGVRVLHLADDEPAESAAVVAEAARLLGVEAPPTVAFEDALAGMSPMARSFWAENRKVSSARTQEMLGYRWRYPSYREGLKAIKEGSTFFL